MKRPPEVLAVVPARGGSKGLPRKNVLPVAGKPLIAWTLEAASRARTVTRVVVSTDDAEIAELCMMINQYLALGRLLVIAGADKAACEIYVPDY